MGYSTWLFSCLQHGGEDNRHDRFHTGLIIQTRRRTGERRAAAVGIIISATYKSSLFPGQSLYHVNALIVHGMVNRNEH
ncbi:hypothetical protein CS542_08115 [Pedobacter sp. IW39]|nr:hypothetical protein CS542_08115 [Pedobacter sp. IW39]